MIKALNGWFDWTWPQTVDIGWPGFADARRDWVVRGHTIEATRATTSRPEVEWPRGLVSVQQPCQVFRSAKRVAQHIYLRRNPLHAYLSSGVMTKNNNCWRSISNIIVFQGSAWESFIHTRAPWKKSNHFQTCILIPKVRMLSARTLSPKPSCSLPALSHLQERYFAVSTWN